MPVNIFDQSTWSDNAYRRDPSKPFEEDYSDYLKDTYTGSNNRSSLVNDSGSDEITKLAKDLNIKLDDTTKDYLMQYYLNEKSSKNSFDREMQASSSQYQRAVQDLRKAGLNPFLAFDSLRGGSASSSSGSVSGGLYTSKRNQDKQTGQQLGSSLMSILGIIAAAVIYALA